MAFWGRTVEDLSKGKTGEGEDIVVDGVAFGSKLRLYPGVIDPNQPRLVDSKGRPFGGPTRGQLADARLHLETLALGLPWPGAANDRFAKGKCENGMANAYAGAHSPFGVWPDEQERTAQSNDRYNREQPVERMEKIIRHRGYQPAEAATARARAQAIAAGADPGTYGTGGLDLESLPMPEPIGPTVIQMTQAAPVAAPPPAAEPGRKRAAG